MEFYDIRVAVNPCIISLHARHVVLQPFILFPPVSCGTAVADPDLCISSDKVLIECLFDLFPLQSRDCSFLKNASFMMLPYMCVMLYHSYSAHYHTSCGDLDNTDDL